MRTRTQRDYQERILKVLIHVQGHLDDPLDLGRLAAVAGFSPFHFHRIFRGMVGEPVREHVRRLRLERAAHELRTTALPVTEVALNAGYETHEAFTRAFRGRFGRPPSAFREAGRARFAAHASGVRYTPDGAVTGFEPLYEKGNDMEATIESREPTRVAFVRHVGPYAEVGSAWEALCGWAGPRGLLGPQATTCGACHDDPEVTPPERIRYDACVAVGEDVEPEGAIGVQTLPGGRYAVTVVEGPYSNLAEAYAVLIGQWMPAQGVEPAPGPCLEVYLNDPSQTPAEELRTLIHVPLKA